MNTILIGGSGLIGSHIISLFPSVFPKDKLICLLRSLPEDESNPSASNQKKNPNVVSMLFDFENPQAIEKLNWKNVDSLLCTLGTTIKKAGSKQQFEKVDYAYPLAFAQAAKKHKVPYFSIVTAMGASSNSSIFYNKVKGKLEEELAKLEIDHLSIFQPSLLMGERKELRPGEEIGKWVSMLMPFGLFGLEKYRPIEGRQVAIAILRKLKQDKETNRNLKQTSPNKISPSKAKIKSQLEIIESDAIAALGNE